MDEEKVVSIEDRIPKLKEARRKKTNRRLIFYICLFFVLISIVVYLQSPLSDISEIDVHGNQYIKSEDIIEQSQLSENVNIFSFRTSVVEERLQELAEIKSTTVKRKFPNHISIEITEFNKIAYVNEGEHYQPLLENGTMLDSFRIVEYQGDAPLLYDFTDQEYLTLFTEQLTNLPQSIANHISEIYWEPTESNPFLIRLYMNDGFEVLASIRNFTDQMSSYPSIVSQLDGTNGTIEMGAGGAIFDANEAQNQEEETVEEQQEESEEDEIDNESEG